MENEITTPKSNSPLMKFWMNFPVWLRAILTGILVNTVGVGIWVLIATFIPAPWSVPVMGIILIIYWMYFSGKWKPSSTHEFRKFCFRKTSLKKIVIIPGALGALFLFIFLNAGMVLTFRIKEFHPEVFKTATYLDAAPVPVAWIFLIMASMVAGICEETGFRGYMQAPMEKKYGPLAAIIITSGLFVVVHLHQAWAGGILFQIFLAGFMISYLAYATNSLIPGIIVHTLFDVVNFSYWWSNVAGTFSYKPISVTGVDNHFLITLTVFSISFIGFVLMIRKLTAIRKTELRESN